MPSTISTNEKFCEIIANCPKSVSYANYLVNMIEGLEKNLSLMIEKIEGLSDNIKQKKSIITSLEQIQMNNANQIEIMDNQIVNYGGKSILI